MSQSVGDGSVSEKLQKAIDYIDKLLTDILDEKYNLSTTMPKKALNVWSDEKLYRTQVFNQCLAEAFDTVDTFVESWRGEIQAIGDPIERASEEGLLNSSLQDEGGVIALVNNAKAIRSQVETRISELSRAKAKVEEELRLEAAGGTPGGSGSSHTSSGDRSGTDAHGRSALHSKMAKVTASLGVFNQWWTTICRRFYYSPSYREFQSVCLWIHRLLFRISLRRR